MKAQGNSSYQKDSAWINAPKLKDTSFKDWSYASLQLPFGLRLLPKTQKNKFGTVKFTAVHSVYFESMQGEDDLLP